MTNNLWCIIRHLKSLETTSPKVTKSNRKLYMIQKEYKEIGILNEQKLNL
jgi:hypothetical protein